MEYNKKVVTGVVEKYVALVQAIKRQAEEAERIRQEMLKREQEAKQSPQGKPKA